MENESVEILLVDDDEDDFIIVKDLLSDIKHTRFNVYWEFDYDKALEKIKKESYDVYLIDYRLGEKNGLDLLKEAVQFGCKSPIIMLTGQGYPEVDYEAMRIGASDYMVKGKINAQTIERSIRYALNHARTLTKLYEQEKKYRQLFEQSINAIYITSKEHLFIDANSSMLHLFGYELDELNRLNLKDLFVHDDEYTTFYKLINQSGQVKDFEVVMQTKSGNHIECNIKATSFVDIEGKVLGFQGIIEDISEKKKVQQEFIRMEKLVMTGNIARSIAHEVRNPLTNISLALEQLSSELPENDTLDIYFDIIKRNTQRINQLITEMLNSSKPSPLNLEKHNLNYILERTLRLAEDRMKLLDVQLETYYDQNLDDIWVDKEKISIAFLNIITNAIEAVESGVGRITIETWEKKDKQFVKISDNGIGIDKENLSNLFDAFHTGKRGGMGLGLTSAQTIINSHKAKISVDSTVGKGTYFTIIFDKKASLAESDK